MTKSIHRNIVSILSCVDKNLKDMYFRFFYEFIISNTFNNEYVTELTNSNFLETIKNHTKDSNIIRQINEFHKNIYSYTFHQRINIHNRRKYCEKLLIQLQGRERVNISSENFNKIITRAGIRFSFNTKLSCDIIRKWLKSLSLSKYNSHVTWLRIQIESAYGIENNSYELSNYEVNKILDHFKTIIDLYRIMKLEPKVLENFKSRKIPNNLNY